MNHQDETMSPNNFGDGTCILRFEENSLTHNDAIWCCHLMFCELVKPTFHFFNIFQFYKKKIFKIVWLSSQWTLQLHNAIVDS